MASVAPALSALNVAGRRGLPRISFDQPGRPGEHAQYQSPCSPNWNASWPSLEANTGPPGGRLRESGKPGMFIAGADLNELRPPPPGSDVARGLRAAAA